MEPKYDGHPLQEAKIGGLVYTLCLSKCRPIRNHVAVTEENLNFKKGYAYKIYMYCKLGHLSSIAAKEYTKKIYYKLGHLGALINKNLLSQKAWSIVSNCSFNISQER